MVEVILNKFPVGRAMGGPERPKGLPYRGPVGPPWYPWRKRSSTFSDGNLDSPVVLDNASRAAGNKSAFHVPQVAICVSLEIHGFGDCESLLREGSQFASYDWDALITTMSTPLFDRLCESLERQSPWFRKAASRRPDCHCGSSRGPAPGCL